MGILLEAAISATKIVAVITLAGITLVVSAMLVIWVVQVTTGLPAPVAASVGVVVFFWLATFGMKAYFDWSESRSPR